METITVRNVNDALVFGVILLREHGIYSESRNGPVLRFPEPVTTVYQQPNERVLFHPWRDANPFFHLVEAVWMLAGRDDLKHLTPYVSRIKDFSDDGGITMPSAYGKRWRCWGSWPDQLDWVVSRLMKDPNDRRVVIQMWDAETDPDAADLNSKDVPCNLTALPWVFDHRLHLTVFNRSNDIIWGTYGANAVHFSILLEYLAARLGLMSGTLTQVSNNFHGYLNTLPELNVNLEASLRQNPYVLDQCSASYPILASGPWVPYGDENRDPVFRDARRERTIKEDLLILFEHGPEEAVTKARWPWLRSVVVPLMLAHKHWKKVRGPDRYEGALEIANQCAGSDWRLAAKQWLIRRRDKAEV